VRILITGGAGFIGSHLCDFLITQGHSVICIDNLLTGNVDNVAHLFGHPGFSFINYDVTNYIHVPGDLDYVLHFASPASPADFERMPIKILKVGALGTHKTLGLAKAKRAKFLLASTSEVYGDPLVHPQSEDYWGNVNVVGIRGVYDEAKRFAEAMTMAYHRYHGLDTRIVRIFNSILADEIVLLFNSDTAHLTPIEEYAHEIERDRLIRPRCILVPAFDPQTGRVSLREATALLKHCPQSKDAFLIRTRYGREIRVTGDHSVFRRNASGMPEAIPVRDLCVGDYIAIAGRLPVVEKDRMEINVGEHLVETAKSPEDLWGVVIISPEMKPVIEKHQETIFNILMAGHRFDGSRSKRNTVGCAYRRYLYNSFLPLYVFSCLRRQFSVAWPSDARLRLYRGGCHCTLPNEIPITHDLLWLLGLFLAEGTIAQYPKSDAYFLTICSHQSALERAKRILTQLLGVKVGLTMPSPTRGPTLYVHSKQLCWVMDEIFGLKGRSAKKRIPSWVFQLPLSRFKWFLEGYRVGDGTHSGKKIGHELAFETVSRGLAQDLVYSLLRFGIVASLGYYESWITNKDPKKRYPFYRITVPEVSNFDILTWDTGVSQTLNATRFGDLVWTIIRSIEPIATTEYVYDFSVPGHENFIAGTGIFAKNTFGPKMRKDDGRAIPNFITQALTDQDLTVFGDGSQTRSVCYVDDLVDGIYRLMLSDVHTPVNIGNPDELTILQLAQKIISLSGSKSQIVFKPLPPDDPKIRRPDITKARTLLSWEPKVSPDEGLMRTIEWFRKTL
jgi:nucleoside-diphosphate-sugar epimerase/intein/homing endonuclease